MPAVCSWRIWLFSEDLSSMIKENLKPDIIRGSFFLWEISFVYVFYMDYMYIIEIRHINKLGNM